MPQKVLRFTGINRIVNEFQNSGACEELINLRPKIGGGFSIVKNKSELRTGVQYDYIYEHAWGDISNLIAVEYGRVILIDTEENEHIISEEFVGKNISLSSAGNILVVYCEKENKQSVYKFKDEAYEPYVENIPLITRVEINGGTRLNGNNKPIYYNTVSIGEDASVGAYNDALQKAASGFYHKYPHGLCGSAVVGCTYELDDGSEIWSTAFVVASIDKAHENSTPVVDKTNKTVTVYGTHSNHISLTFKEIDGSSIRRVNVYASRPVFQYEITGEGVDNYIIEKTSLSDLNLDGNIMYYQGSVVPASGRVNLLLNFGETQAGESIMDVTSGCITRVGKVVSYNNRFHYHHSSVEHILQVPTVSNIYFENATELEYWIAYVKFDEGWKLINRQFSFKSDAINDFIYPMAGIKQLAFVKAKEERNGQIITGITVPYEEVFFVDLKDSSAYNYSYAFEVTPNVVLLADDFYDELYDNGQIWGNNFDTKTLLKKETNAINVSAPYNPFVFPVKYSYSFSGEILDITTSYIPISSTQVGEYPLTVFTSNGIFSLEQGSGQTLYSNILPINPMVIQGRATSCPYGIFFVSSKNLYLLSGREAVAMSNALSGELELDIRNSDAYKKLCCNTSGQLYDFSRTISQKRFEEYIIDASLTYDQLNNELIISNFNLFVDYSYVLNLDTKSFYKINKRYTGASSGSRYVLDINKSDCTVVNMQEEYGETKHILLQSRPMSFETFSTHVQRLIMLVDAKLEQGHNFCFSVFGSDNLHDWKCIISAQKQNTVLRQIRTNRAAKSYRDYIIIINGTVGADTNLSDIIADYTVVSRRLG